MRVPFHEGCGKADERHPSGAIQLSGPDRHEERQKNDLASHSKGEEPSTTRNNPMDRASSRHLSYIRSNVEEGNPSNRNTSTAAWCIRTYTCDSVNCLPGTCQVPSKDNSTRSDTTVRNDSLRLVQQ